jgi:hypothetical protein
MGLPRELQLIAIIYPLLAVLSRSKRQAFQQRLTLQQRNQRISARPNLKERIGKAYITTSNSMLSDELTMNHDATLAPFPVQAKRKNLRLARGYQCEARTGFETNNSPLPGRTELKAPLQRSGLNLNNSGLKPKPRQQTLQF